jgi:hypothetical protein
MQYSMPLLLHTEDKVDEGQKETTTKALKACERAKFNRQNIDGSQPFYSAVTELG